MSRGISAGVALLIAALALTHPALAAGAAGAPAAAIAARGPLWLATHTALLLAFLTFGWRLGRHTTGSTQAALRLFAVANTAYLALDGLVVGALASSDPSRAAAVWNAPALGILANAVGALWAAALLLLAWIRLPHSQRTMLSQVALALTWLCFAASAAPGGVPPLASRFIAAATAALVIYRRGTPAMSAALLTVAAVFRIHVGAEAAVGLLLIAGAELTRPHKENARER
ncbi:MAG: hypothetical protein NVSMB2_02280 [Chloroflexota bacterium]